MAHCVCNVSIAFAQGMLLRLRRKANSLNISDYSIIHLSIQLAIRKEFTKPSACTVTHQQHFQIHNYDKHL